MKNILILLVSLVMVFAWTLSAHALLLSRLGGLAVYDDDLDLTWLTDANAGAGSTFDNGFSTTDGRMSWSNALQWAHTLTVDGVTGWRLPTTTQPDATCANQLAGTPPQGIGLGCTGSEMGHLYNVEGISTLSPGIFTNVPGAFSWSNTTLATDPSRAWGFIFGNGSQGTSQKSISFNFAWAVHSGDVAPPSPSPAPAPVPEPGTFILMGSGLIALVLWKRRGLPKNA